jgi:NTE family protein
VSSASGAPSFFDGVPADEVAEVLGRLESRRFPAGSVVVAEGDYPRQIYVTESGSADVFVADSNGAGKRVGRIAAGTTVGEMSLFTGEAASATVRALDDLVVRVLSESEFQRLATAYPQVYRNLGAILSNRLVRTNQLAARGGPGQLTVVRGEAVAAHALACSVAWHAREPTVLVAAGDRPELEAFAERRGTPGARADVVLDRVGSDRSLAALAHDLAAAYTHVLVLGDAHSGQLTEARTIELPAGIDLDAADRAALGDGVLPSSTPAGRALGRVARSVAGLSVGLALGAGSMRGYAHVGVLRGLAKIGLEPDYLCGTSIGAAVAAHHACGFELESTMTGLDRCARALFRPRLPVRGFMSSAALGRALHEIYGERRIEELPIPLGIVAADLLTRREIVFRRGLVWRAVLASVSIPGIYPAQRIGPYALVDGAVVNSVPTDVAADMGAGAVIAVRLMGPPDGPETDAEAVDASAPPPSAFTTILRSLEIMQARTSREGIAATVTITPDLAMVPGSKLRNFAEGGRFSEAGEAAVEAALPRIASILPWVASS